LCDSRVFNILISVYHWSRVKLHALNRKILSRNNAKLHHQSRTRIAPRPTDLELTIGTLCHSIVALWSHCY